MATRAMKIPMTMRTLIAFERIIGSERVMKAVQNLTIDVTVDEKLAILTDVFGYDNDEAQDLPLDVVEDELTVFMTRWLAGSIEGRLRSLASQHSNTASAATRRSGATTSARKPSTRKTPPSK